MTPPLDRRPVRRTPALLRSCAAALVAALAPIIFSAPPAYAEKVFYAAALVAEDQFLPAYEGFRSKMSELGYSPQKIRYELHNAKGNINELKLLSQKIVQQSPDVIVTSSTTATVPVAKATEGTNIPVVFLSSGNPLKLVKSY